jgi:hypothetical protein
LFAEDVSDDSFHLDENSNIDQAMLGLYSLPDQVFTQQRSFARLDSGRRLSNSVYDTSTLLHQSSSYIPQEDYDPMLDGGYIDSTEEQITQELSESLWNYETSEDWQTALSKDSEEPLSIHRNESCNSSDDDEFGDFQSAADSTPASLGKEDKESKVEALLQTPQSSLSEATAPAENSSLGSGTTSGSTINTVGLVRRLDELMHSTSTSMDDSKDLATTLSNDDYSTPVLLAHARELLERTTPAKHPEETILFVKSENNSDSDATSTINVRRQQSLSYATPSRQLAPEFSSSDRVSLDLPVSDLTTLEGQWIRRRQLERERTFATAIDPDIPTLKDIMNGLPEQYQLPENMVDEGSNEANNSMVRILNSVPWGYVHDIAQTQSTLKEQDMLIWDDFFVGQLSQLDSSLQSVQKLMAASVKPAKLEAANSMVHSCEENLRLARIYWDRSSKALDAATSQESDGKVGGLLGYARLLELWDQKESLVELHNILEHLEDAIAQEQDIVRRIDTFDFKQSRAQDEYVELVHRAESLRNALDGKLASLSCLKDFRQNRLTSVLEERFWDRLKFLARQCVVKACRGQDVPVSEYRCLMKASFGLFEASWSNHLSLIEPSDSMQADSRFEESTGWSRNIVSSVIYELDRCLAIALLEPIEPEDSEYMKDLRSLEIELETGWGDSAKLKSLTHNLVTIRFDFEACMFYLPKVATRLCECLLGVLKAFLVFYREHACLDEPEFAENDTVSSSVESMSYVAKRLCSAAESLWEKCELVMTHLLDEYKHFAGRRNLRLADGGGLDIVFWEQELQGLHTTKHVFSSLLCLKEVFLGKFLPAEKNLETKSSVVFDSFSELARDHLRIVHSEAMTSMGRMLGKESWHLISFRNLKESEKKVDRSSSHFPSREALMCALQSALRGHEGLTTNIAASSHPRDISSLDSLSLDQPESLHLWNDILSAPAARSENSKIARIHGIIDSGLQNSEEDGHRLVTHTITDGLIPWVSRLVLVALKLPQVAGDAFSCIENLFDLYFVTVFRLCAGSRRNERLILGDDSSVAFESIPFGSPRSRASSPSLPTKAGLERSPSGKPPSIPYRTSVTISSTLDVEMCAPMLKDIPETLKLRKFIDRAQTELQANVKLDRVDSWIGNPKLGGDPEEYACAAAKSIERREAAIWSCLTVASLADLLHTAMQRYSTISEDFDSGLHMFNRYVEDTVDIVESMYVKGSEIACTRAMAPFTIVKEIVEVGVDWEENKLHEQPNEYVDNLCERVCLIWAFVATSGKLPQHLVAVVWERLQSLVYLTLLEGFSRVIYCSTEGRALMALDLASVASNLRRDAVCDRLEVYDLPLSPPRVSPTYGKQYVDLYVKVFYYPRDDILGWISDNYCSYRLHHMITLLSSSQDRGRENLAPAVVEQIKILYDTKQTG